MQYIHFFLEFISLFDLYPTFIAEVSSNIYSTPSSKFSSITNALGQVKLKGNWLKSNNDFSWLMDKLNIKYSLTP